MFMLMIMILLGYKMLFHSKFNWVKCYFYQSTKLKWSLKINEYDIFVLTNKGSYILSNIYKIINVHLH
jgi:hypothetical protein